MSIVKELGEKTIVADLRRSYVSSEWSAEDSLIEVIYKETHYVTDGGAETTVFETLKSYFISEAAFISGPGLDFHADIDTRLAQDDPSVTPA